MHEKTLHSMILCSEGAKNAAGDKGSQNMCNVVYILLLYRFCAQKPDEPAGGRAHEDIGKVCRRRQLLSGQYGIQGNAGRHVHKPHRRPAEKPLFAAGENAGKHARAHGQKLDDLVDGVYKAVGEIKERKQQRKHQYKDHRGNHRYRHAPEEQIPGRALCIGKGCFHVFVLLFLPMLMAEGKEIYIFFNFFENMHGFFRFMRYNK